MDNIRGIIMAALRIQHFALIIFLLLNRSEAAEVIRDVEYARIGDQSLQLDLHIPQGRIRSPLIVWVHGGAWRSGSKSDLPIKQLFDQGYAIASVDYRLSTAARFPAQVHDLKAAIRFLRAEGSKWRLSTKKVVVAGDSAGAHLAALVGVSNGNAELEGSVGSALSSSSAVQGIISFYGAANLTTILNQSTPHGLSVRVPALDLLLGGQPEALPALAKLASPVFYVDASDPPLLLLHGDQDPQMPINQSLELQGAYQKAKAYVELVVVHGAAHGGGMFYDAERMEVVRKFLRRHF
ncbi:MAG: nlhH 5 [Verrucomicrobiales bacterium]|nr:nlhH 5 [Verrucomicrobiales bacterium]